MRRAGLLLVLCAILGAGFYLFTDPHLTPNAINQLGWGANLVDAVHDAMAGTLIGLAGVCIIGCIGLWLLVRRSL